ncbi:MULTISPECIES: methyltransferase domain-containing protein [Delftia]|uniref:Methyltransferase domain-containing protein n=2 Tax=Delftia TaxID=80865 RepID=A0A7T2S2U7_DELAC|nr:methyltransferase domain-containing protein [Delftia acidovorans]QPS07832.1 methyltransferase domain-containing protein [Delftia acidovorans]
MSATSIPADINRKHLEMARQQIAKGDLQKAAQTLNKAHRQVPGDARVFMLGGLMAEKAGNIGKAGEAFERCLELAPMWGPGILETALFRARHNEFESAVELAEKVARIEPHNSQVLAGVVDISHRAGHLEMAVRHLRRGLELHKGDPMLRQYLASDLDSLGQKSEAQQLWDELVTEFPEQPAYRLGRVKSHISGGTATSALADILLLQEQFPEDESLAHYASLAKGETPSHQPVAIHMTMFDNMAKQFDKHLVLELGYQLPKLVAQQLIERHPNKDFNLLDLGCGTGLLGACLKPMQGFLIGVDSSLKMIEEAAKHGVYDRFHNVDLLGALQNTPANEYDVLTLLDVLIYVGDAQMVIPNAARILKTGGEFIFSCETAPEEGPDLVLQSSQRYAHKRSHIETLCKQAGFSVSTEELVLRQEGGEPVQGFVVTATKTAA